MIRPLMSVELLEDPQVIARPLPAPKAASGLTASTALGLLASVALWSSAFPGIRYVLASFEPTHLILVRFGTASIALLIIAMIKGIHLPAKRDLGLMLLGGLLGVSGYQVGLAYGARHVTAGTASLLVNICPIFVALIAVLFLKEKFGLRGWAGSLLCFGGVMVLGWHKGLEFEPHVLILAAAAFCNALYVILCKGALQRYTPFDVTCWSLWGGTAGVLLFAPGAIHDLRAAPWQHTAIIIYLGLLPGLLAQILWTQALQRIPAARAINFTYAVPIGAYLIGWLWLGEVVTTLVILGGILIVAGLVLVNSRASE